MLTHAGVFSVDFSRIDTGKTVCFLVSGGLSPVTLFVVFRARLFSGADSAVGTGVSAGTAVQASAGIDDVTIITLRNSTHGASISASAAAHASRTDLISHSMYLHIECNNIVP